MENKNIIAYMLILVAVATSVYLSVDSKALIPAGYKLAVDGYLISRTLVIIFTLYLISKIGFYLIKKED